MRSRVVASANLLSLVDWLLLSATLKLVIKTIVNVIINWVVRLGWSIKIDIVIALENGESRCVVIYVGVTSVDVISLGLELGLFLAPGIEAPLFKHRIAGSDLAITSRLSIVLASLVATIVVAIIIVVAPLKLGYEVLVLVFINIFFRRLLRLIETL